MTSSIDAQSQIERYSSDIRKAAYWYARLIPYENNCDVNDFLQAGRIAVWNVYERRPDMINNVAYVKGAIKYGIFKVIRDFKPKISQINVVRDSEGEFVPVVDILPSHDKSLEDKIDVDDLCHNISKKFSLEDADSLKILVGRSDITALNLYLNSPPKMNLKERVKLVTSMDLSDEDMLIYAQVLIGEKGHFPRDTITGNPKRVKKYIQFLLNYLKITPEEFASKFRRKELFSNYRLAGPVNTIYGMNSVSLIKDLFPDIPTFKIYHSFNKWQGIEGLINAFDAMENLLKYTGKSPIDLDIEDFRKASLSGMLCQVFGQSVITAVEFRWPNTYDDNFHYKVKNSKVRASKLWSKIDRETKKYS